MLHITVLSLFPEMFTPLDHSIIGRAQKEKLLNLEILNIRDFSQDKHHKVDDIPYGGGAGMVLTPEPLAKCIQHAKQTNTGPLIYLTPGGETWRQELAEEFSLFEDFILLCGHYEGIDQRIIDLFVDRQISIGDYVLTGGELPALSIIDSVARLVPGVLGKDHSSLEESFSLALDRKKEYPHYTRPAEFMGLIVPPVLLSGNHKEIAKWRKLHTHD